MTLVLQMAVCSSYLRNQRALLRLTDGFVRVDLWKGRVLLSNTSLLHREEDLLKPLEKPRTGNVRLVDKFGNVESILGQVSTARVPRYLVKSPQHYPRSLRYESIHDSPVKIIGFGERFVAGRHEMQNSIFTIRPLNSCLTLNLLQKQTSGV